MIHFSGLKWKTNVNLAVVEKLEKESMKYMESIVRRGEYACISQPRAVYMGRKRSKEVRMRRREEKGDDMNVVIEMPSSASSFHSFSNENRLEICESYGKIVDTWSVKNMGEDLPELGLKGEIDEWIGKHAIHAFKVNDKLRANRVMICLRLKME